MQRIRKELATLPALTGCSGRITGNAEPSRRERLVCPNFRIADQPPATGEIASAIEMLQQKENRNANVGLSLFDYEYRENLVFSRRACLHLLLTSLRTIDDIDTDERILSGVR